jgi:hypothetical protein
MYPYLPEPERGLGCNLVEAEPKRILSLKASKGLDGGAGIANYWQMSGARKKGAAMRLQYAALPYRRGSNSRTEVMLVTSRETGSRTPRPRAKPVKRQGSLEESSTIRLDHIHTRKG